MEERENMNKYRNVMARVGGTLLLAGAIVAISPQRADAAFVVAVCDDAACNGAGDVFVEDESGEVGLGIGVPGLINFNAGAVAGWEVTLTSTQTKPLFGSAAQPAINLTYQLTNSGGGASQIWLYAGDTDFTGGGNATLVVNSTTAGQNTTGFLLGGDDNNVNAPSGVNLAPTLLTLGPFAGVFSASGSAGPVGAVTPYALTVGVTIVDAGGLSLSSGDATVTVPEPATMSLFGLGLFGTALAARRRLRKQA
jgi:hypothetical protein